jgi:hypothetical protein
MSKVTIAPSKEGNLVTAYEGNAEFGYLILAQTKSLFVNGWLREVTNRTIMKGAVSALQSFVQANPTLEVGGQLCVKEYKEDEVPASTAQQHFDKSLPYEEQIDGYIKRAGNDGPALMSGGKRILRFTVWDQAGTDTDITVSHENVDEIKAFNATKSTDKADLPS